MNLPINVEAILRGGLVEWERLEFKEGWNPEAILHTVCAFANDFHNLGGGYIFVGIKAADGRPELPPVGVPPSQLDGWQQELLQLGYHKMQPAYHPITAPYEVDGQAVLVIWCPGGQHRPYKALETLGLKAGKPAYGEGTKASGPEVKMLLEFTDKDNKVQRLPLEKCLVHRDGGKELPPLKWHFTGSVIKQPDPEKDEMVYGADLSGTFFSLFPVTDTCVLQTHLTLKDEPNYKLEVNTKVLPKEGTAIKLLLVAE